VPIYEYQCEHCEHKLEAIQKISDAPLKDCPECKQETLRKLVSAAAFKLTGTGWYETDFKHNNSKARDDKKPAKSSDKQDTTKETKGKESESKADKPKKKESVGQSSK
jgi:putative FmdB family regulatory protein